MYKEYGGYLPLELAKINKGYFEDNSKDLISLNCARSAIYYALIDANASKVYVPYYNCPSVIETINEIDIEYEYYYLDENLLPIDVECKENEYILWVNYFGNASEGEIKEVLKRYDKLIIDNSQAFYSPPITGHYNVYSCRKFFGVPDGAYLIKKDIEKKNLEKDISYENAIHLLKVIEMGTNAVYPEHLENEAHIADEVLLMSTLTERILTSIDYEEIKRKRKENFDVLHNLLSEQNEMGINVISSTHMVYPFLSTDTNLREFLLKNKIYTPSWWKSVLNLMDKNGVEKYLSNNLIPLPIDQRYDKSDMTFIANKILGYLRRDKDE